MPRNAFRPFVIVLTLAAVLGTPLVSLAGPHRGVSGRAESRLEERSSLGWLWGLLERVWEKEGCLIDPNGRCIKESVVAPKAGCSIDPYGQCVTEPVTAPKAGCMIDPHGQCLP